MYDKGFEAGEKYAMEHPFVEEYEARLAAEVTATLYNRIEDQNDFVTGFVDGYWNIMDDDYNG